MTFCMKDHDSWLLDVCCVKAGIAEYKHTIKKVSTSDKGVVKFTFDTPAYEVTEWVHQEPKYAAFLAIAKNGSHTVTWYEPQFGKEQRW